MKHKILASAVAVAIFVLAAVSAVGGLAHADPAATGAVYTIDNSASGNSVLQYQAASSGVLTLAGTFSTHGTGTGAALASQGSLQLTQDGRWLIAVDAGSNQITVFHVNEDGGLTFASIVGSQGTDPISVTITRHVSADAISGGAAATGQSDLAYVLNAGTSTIAGNIAGFSLSNNGQLTFIPGSNQPVAGGAGASPEQIGFNNNGGVLVVTEKATNQIDTYAVGDSGVAGSPTVTPSNSGGPYGFAFTKQGYLVVSEAGAGTLSTYEVSDIGTLRTISGSIPDFGLAPCWVAVSHDGRFAYTSNAHGGTISGYTISGSGRLDLFSSVAAKTSIPTLDLAFSGDGQFLFVLNGGQITTFQTYPDGGIAQVSAVGGVPASAAGLAAS